MINLQSQAAGQKSSQLLSQANSEALSEGTEKLESGKTFTNLMTEFLGLNVEQGAKKKQETKLKNAGFDSLGELIAKKEGGEIQLDATNLKNVGKEGTADSEDKLQTIDFPDEFLIQLSNLIQKADGQGPLTGTGKDTKAEPVQLVQEGEKQFKKPAKIEDTLKALNKLLEGLQIKRTDEKFVITTPDSNTELTAEKKENIQNQLLKIIRQLPGDSDNKSLKHLFSEFTAKTDVQAKHGTNLEQVTASNKEASAPMNFLSNNRDGVMKNGDVQNGKTVESVSNGNQKTDTQQTQKLTLKNLIRQFSEEVEIKTEKSGQSKTGSQQLNTESKESDLFPNSKEKSGLSAKQLTSQPDQNPKTDANISKILPNENSKKEGESAGLMLKTQNTKESSPAKLVEKSQAKPIQISSISEIKKDETAFKPLIKIETQNGNVDFEFQSNSDADSGDSEEGKSFLKLNNTSFNQLTKSSGRREFSTQMVKQLQKQADQSGLGTAKNWSQHRFVLESGDSVNVAVRQAEGVMQLQLGAGNSELNKILVQHINEIRQHLQEQMNIDIDLQLQQFGDQQADLNDNGQNSGNGKQESNDGTGLRQYAEGEVGGSTTRTRYLGFNQNEWTA